MDKKNRKRNAIRARRRKEQRKMALIWGFVGLGVLAILGVMIWNFVRPGYGQEIPIQGAEHTQDGGPLREYNSDPPTSGTHYSEGLPPGFYDEANLGELPTNPVGYLVHNLEHGYVIFWYNCELLDQAGCAQLKDEIGSFIDGSSVRKLIAFPWASTEVPLVLASWGFMLELEAFDAQEAQKFISSNRLRAPEPNAP